MGFEALYLAAQFVPVPVLVIVAATWEGSPKVLGMEELA